MKRTEPISVASIIDSVFNEGDSARRMLLSKASYLWIEVVGEGINRHTVRRYVTDNGTLHVYISSPALRNDLSFHRTRLLEEINARLGKPVLTDIQIH